VIALTAAVSLVVGSLAATAFGDDARSEWRFARPAGSPSDPPAAAEPKSGSSELKWKSPARRRRTSAREVSNSQSRRSASDGQWARKVEDPSRESDDPFADPFGDASPARTKGAVLRSPQGESELESADPSLELEIDGDRMQPPGPLEEELAQRPDASLPPCPTRRDLRPIREITNDISPEGDLFPPECPADDRPFAGRSWAPTCYTWKASGLCHKPLYFEEIAVERYGHSWGPLVQPFVSAAHFFGTLPLLPYKAGVEPPGECIYALGYYRPGNCAPHMIRPIPVSLRGAALEGGAVSGLIFLLP
jgi:hypothetical protein